MKIICFLFACGVGLCGQQPAVAETIHARIQTSMGDIDLALDAEKAPVTVENFLSYATSGHYDRLTFHRVVPGQLIQGGGYNVHLLERATRDPIVNEADNGLTNRRGTIAMARNLEPHSARSQFFINLRDNPRLDFRDKELMANWGYAVFGEVVAGMDVVDAIGMVPTGPDGPFAKEVPLEPVVIIRIDPIAAEEVGATQTSPVGVAE